MMTRAEAKKNSRHLARERARALKLDARRLVRELRAAVKRARLQKKAQIKAARLQCKAHRRLLVQRAKARRARLVRELRETTLAERSAARARCTSAKERAHTSGLTDVEKAAHALHHERSYQREIAMIEANNRRARLGIVRASKAERAQESAGEVRGNLPPELVPLWERVQKRIKGSTRKSRTEAFLEYAQAHPHEVVEAQEGGVDDVIRELEKRQAEAERVASKPSLLAKLAKITERRARAERQRLAVAYGQGSEVPF